MASESFARAFRRVASSTSIKPITSITSITQGTTLARPLLARFLSAFLGSDPSLLRLHVALRSAIATLMTGVVAIGWTVANHQPLTLAAFALLFAMVAPLFLRDATPRGWFRSLGTLYIVGSASFAIASALAGWPLVADAGFLAVLFAGVLAQACGPRALGSAMMAVVTFYLGLYLHPSVPHTLGTLALSMTGVAMIVLVGRVLVPTKPADTLRRALNTVARRAGAVLADRRAGEPEAIRHLSLLNEAALAVEEQLSLFSVQGVDRLRACLIDVEVAAGQHAIDSLRITRSDARLRIALKRFVRASRNAVSAARQAPRSGPAREPGFVAAILASRAAWSWLPACRATTAAFIAMLIGQSVSPERWFWAVITTFVVFLGTRSRGDTIRKTGERVLGTLAGVAVSAALVASLHGMPWLLVAAMIACVFGWAYFILTAYGQGVFFITVLVGLVYGELGFAIGPLIEMRVEEVFIGCVVSIVVAVTMLPLRTSLHADAKVSAVLDAVDDVMRASASHASAAHAMSAMRALDRRWHELRIALRPLKTQQAFSWNSNVELVVGSLFACVQAARELARESARESARPVAHSGEHERAARERLAGALSMLASRTQTPATHSHAIASGVLLGVH